jgi:hypothetical protein
VLVRDVRHVHPGRRLERGRWCGGPVDFALLSRVPTHAWDTWSAHTGSRWHVALLASLREVDGGALNRVHGPADAGGVDAGGIIDTGVDTVLIVTGHQPCHRTCVARSAFGVYIKFRRFVPIFSVPYERGLGLPRSPA